MNIFDCCDLYLTRVSLNPEQNCLRPYLIEEIVHKSSFDSDVDVIGSDIVIVALRLQKENNTSASDNRIYHLIAHTLQYLSLIR